MLRSFLLIDGFEPEPSSSPSSSESGPPSDPSGLEATAETILQDLGFRVETASSFHEVQFLAGKADAVLLSVVPQQVEPWRQKIAAVRSLPLLWWCDRRTFPSYECKLPPGIDGMLGPGMSALEMHCALLLGFNQYGQRTEWQREREQLLSRLEERKWIDQAKRILCEIKSISETEAYEFLRKQAMNERKRMSDVASSIVKVYQLLQDGNQRGRKR
ncbi:ANTAR domain-containing response regulator [Paenibacillus tyrfis]|uniref:ANTAR domain-containing response regulator n=1 Tax=Paenibacillus tyrfis TaxID=1501230 RepID=UPI00209E0208|nr:ANTAR domain-containing protein [Paenibacillus tyrfis]MCP1308015.1 ANTAR domain-containing protein [Paenibacillus tyrfis]